MLVQGDTSGSRLEPASFIAHLPEHPLTEPAYPVTNGRTVYEDLSPSTSVDRAYCLVPSF